MLIETEIVPALAKADEQFEVDRENDDMEIYVRHRDAPINKSNTKGGQKNVRRNKEAC